MRLLSISLMTALIVTFGAINAMAVDTSLGPYTVSASVDSQLTFTANITRWSGNTKEAEGLSELSFGQLTRPASGALYASKSFHVYLTSNTTSRPYSITMVGTQLTRSGGTETILDGAYTVNPVWAGQGGTNFDIVGDTLGTAGSAVNAAAKTLYTSNVSGQASVLEVIFAIPPRNADGTFAPGQSADVSPDQAGGTYSGTVTFTLTI